MNDRRTEKPITKARLNMLGFGSGCLIVFLVSVFILSIGLIAQLSKQGFKEVITGYWGWVLAFIVIENIIFWTGIILVYITGKPVGKMRLKSEFNTP